MRQIPIIIALCAGPALPASAQGRPTGIALTAPVAPAPTQNIDREIRDGRRAGQLTRWEAKQLRGENAVTRSIAERYAAGGLSDSERAELQVRDQVMHDQVLIRRTQKPR
jgi:hypothetical protein